jgi:hypothetical protein
VDVKSNDNIIITFKDIMNDKRDLSYFTRILSNQEYIFEDGQLKLKKAVQKVPFLTKLKANTYNSKAFITMDLETRVINNVMTSYCVSIYDGKQFQSFYLADYESDKEMLTASIRYLMRRKYHNHIVYLHNFSKFDAIFILSIMTDLCEDVKPLIKDNKFIDLKIKFNEKYVLRFRDSLLLLPSSLRNLAKEFKVDNKGIFPYKFVNDISLTYKGAAPNFNYFDNVTKDEYDIYAKNYNNN